MGAIDGRGRLRAIAAAALAMATLAAADAGAAGGPAAFQAALAGAGWDGKTIPAGQQCRLNGGRGATPAFKLTGIPKGTTAIVIQYNDRNYRPLSEDGGHGTIGYRVKGATATLPSVPGGTSTMPAGAFVVAAAKSWGDYASPGYLPPCSGGAGHMYFADIMAVAALDGNVKAGTVLATVRVEIGRY